MENANMKLMEKALNFLKVHPDAEVKLVLTILDAQVRINKRLRAVMALARQHPDIDENDIVSLFSVAKVITTQPDKVATKTPPIKRSKRKAGTMWTMRDMDLLMDLKKRGMSTAEIATVLERTEVAVNVAYSKLMQGWNKTNGGIRQ